ncbi:MAG TPA: quinone-dependent dihydroorotate dehydrogenase [Bacteroidetes bacterium]|nr:quinone-dependent dihydroorotate dehydrogenase [Bacteroidota bacterium]
MYKQFIRPLLFLLPPEKAHKLVTSILKFSTTIPFSKYFFNNFFHVKSPNLRRKIAGLEFENPVGLAAGFDKDAEIYKEMGMLGFGFIEIGTVTPLAQPGNPKPRLFRLKKDGALINRMGFNNKGVDNAVENLKKRKNKNIIIGGNIGKNKNTPLEKSVEDYTKSFEKLFDFVDYFVINVSSPNTPNLRSLQDKEPLTELISGIFEINNSKTNSKPVFLKIAPDLSEGQLDDIIGIVNSSELAGVIATNTTISRDGLVENSKIIEDIGAGGLSGKPLKDKSTSFIRKLRKKLNSEKFIIGVGGIFTPEDAIEKIEAGADLVQIYTGFIYEGASLIKSINKELIKISKS